MEDLLRLASQAAKQNIDWQGIGAALSSFVIPMCRTPQNPDFHSEGDVWTHTKLVCEELVKLDGFCRLDENRQQVVFLTALLHDIGKIPTTRWEENKWTSPSHTIAGAKMARQFLWQELGLCGTPERQQLRETVCLLIRYHSFPSHALDAPDGRRKLLAIAANGQLCPMFTIELLCVLCQADALGRKCADAQDRVHMAEQVLLCAEFARENGCWQNPFPFPSEHTRYSYLAGKDIAPEIPFYDDTWGEVILLSGLPGTGKDTWIRENCPDLPMISLDAIRSELGISPLDNQSAVVAAGTAQAKALLRKKQRFVWNATNITPQTRQRQIDLFTGYGASVRVVYLETPWQEQLRRNAGRAAAVPEAAVCHMLEKLTPPERFEAHKVQWHCI